MRDLPWRNDPDPYKIWLSEVILQQTRVDQGLPYYFKFVEKYPTVFDLATADINEVMRTWQGLGYYSRARNLHKCAGIIVNQFKGKFPEEKKLLLKLPGIGKYTAAAIASFAFGKPEAVVDGNVIRVITRLFGIRDDIGKNAAGKRIQEIADGLITNDDPGIHNQAMMEFGALHCSPKKPNCSNCDFRGFCYAQLHALQNEIPFKASRIKKQIRFFTYLVINIDGCFLLQKRQGKDIWNGLFEFLLIETSTEISIDELRFPDLLTDQPDQWQLSSESKIYKHLLTHQTIMCRFLVIDTYNDFIFRDEQIPEIKLYSSEEIEHLPKSILIDRYLEEKK